MNTTPAQGMKGLADWLRHEARIYTRPELVEKYTRWADAVEALAAQSQPANITNYGRADWDHEGAAQMILATERGERVQPSGVEAAIEEFEYAVLARAAGAGPMVRIDNAKQAIRALASSMGAPSVPDGWMLVPIEPTEAMAQAGYRARSYGPMWPARSIWTLMLAASPSPSKEAL